MNFTRCLLRTRTLVWALTALLATASLASAQDWTRFRGPNGQGVSPSVLPAKVTPDDYNWRIELPGIGHSSPVIWKERVYVLSADPEYATRHVLCLDAATGSTIWRRDFPSTPHHLHLRSSFASCTPTVDEDRVYVAWSTPEETTLLALSHDGDLDWYQDLGPWTSQHGFGTSPILYEDLVILSNSQQARQLKEGQKPGKSFMMAFKRDTGEEVWRTPRTSVNVCYSVPCIYQLEGGEEQLVCCGTGNGIFSLDPKTGEENWSIDVFKMRTVSSPVLVDNLIFGSTGSGGGGNYVVAVRADGTNPEIAYEVKREAPYVPTPVAKDGLIFLWSDAGIVHCLDAETGDEIWKKRVGGNYSGSPVIAGDKVYCLSDDGELVVVAASREYELLGRSDLGEASRSTPAVAGGRMYLRTYSHLVSIGNPSS